jgi:hypothetical protein
MSEAPTVSALTWDGERPPLAKALVAAQKATESIKKAATNPAFKSKYADLAQVVEGVVPALNAAGVMVLQCPGFDGEMVAVTTTFLHESGASVTSTLHVRPSKTDAQGVGSAITYARRYALLAMAGGAPEDDDGNAASGPRQERPAAKHQETRPPTLGERADRLEATLKGVHSLADLDKAFKLASGLCAELDAKDPERLADVEGLYRARTQELSPEGIAA